MSSSDALYNEAYGPGRTPRYMRGARNGIWDDPTWLSVEIDEEFLAKKKAEAELDDWFDVRRKREIALALAIAEEAETTGQDWRTVAIRRCLDPKWVAYRLKLARQGG